METFSKNGTVPTYTMHFFRRQSGKLTGIVHESEGLGTRLLLAPQCACFQRKNLR